MGVCADVTRTCDIAVWRSMAWFLKHWDVHMEGPDNARVLPRVRSQVDTRQ